jgi:hypothetical protein
LAVSFSLTSSQPFAPIGRGIRAATSGPFACRGKYALLLGDYLVRAIFTRFRMKAHVRLGMKVLAMAALLGFVAANAQADDKKDTATGTWKWTRKGPDGQEHDISATFKQDGEKLTGKVKSTMGELEIKDGKVKDGEITFYVTFEREGNEVKVKFSGKQTGDAIKGKIDIGEQTLDWEPKRVKEDKK